VGLDLIVSLVLMFFPNVTLAIEIHHVSVKLPLLSDLAFDQLVVCTMLSYCVYSPESPIRVATADWDISDNALAADSWTSFSSSDLAVVVWKLRLNSWGSVKPWCAWKAAKFR
jgi:ABC-type transport system involved in Fe-S cluster assembly fused permease/ATPase subunit